MHQFEERVIQWIVLILCLTGGFLSDNDFYPVNRFISRISPEFGCEISTISHHEDSQRNGSLHSPNWPNLYPNSICHIYKFTGRETERVKLNFTSFNVQGIPPIIYPEGEISNYWWVWIWMSENPAGSINLFYFFFYNFGWKKKKNTAVKRTEQINTWCQ